MAELVFNRDFAPDYGCAVTVAPGVRRLTARNPGSFTFTGTNTYIVGARRVAVVDPGPDDQAHLDALRRAIEGETITHILVTHAHSDHCAGAPALAALTGAPILAAARRARDGEAERRADFDRDVSFAPDAVLADGTRIGEGEWQIEAVATPGHASDHLAFALGGGRYLFSGDHVMGWSTTVVAPPDGSMASYISSLDRLLARRETIYLPAHGGPIENALRYVAALKAHRLEREAAILARLAAGDRTIREIVAAVYVGLDPRLAEAAGQSVLAHLEDLVARRIVSAEGSLSADGVFALIGRAS